MSLSLYIHIYISLFVSLWLSLSLYLDTHTYRLLVSIWRVLPKACRESAGGVGTCLPASWASQLRAAVHDFRDEGPEKLKV